MIMTILARIFGRLENILLLWQSGNLPAPPIRTAQPPRPPIPYAPHRRIRPSARQTRHHPHSRALHAREDTPQTAAAMPARNPAADCAPSNTVASPTRPRPARDPPPAAQPVAHPSLRGSALTPIILRYRNNALKDAGQEQNPWPRPAQAFST